MPSKSPTLEEAFAAGDLASLEAHEGELRGHPRSLVFQVSFSCWREESDASHWQLTCLFDWQVAKEGCLPACPNAKPHPWPLGCPDSVAKRWGPRDRSRRPGCPTAGEASLPCHTGGDCRPRLGCGYLAWCWGPCRNTKWRLRGLQWFQVQVGMLSTVGDPEKTPGAGTGLGCSGR